MVEKMKPQSVDEWLDEIENHSTRRERFIEEVLNKPDMKAMLMWFETAWKLGAESARPRPTTDPCVRVEDIEEIIGTLRIKWRESLNAQTIEWVLNDVDAAIRALSPAPSAQEGEVEEIAKKMIGVSTGLMIAVQCLLQESQSSKLTKGIKESLPACQDEMDRARATLERNEG